MRFFHQLFLAILLATGLSLMWLGWQLIALGGSAYYLPAGIAMAASAVLIWRKSVLGPKLYGVFFVATLTWALWESGLDGWALAPRLAMPAALGLWMLAPWTREAMGQPSAIPGSRIVWPAIALLIFGGIASIYWSDRITGGTAPANFAEKDAPGSPDWMSYGNDQGGSRYSSLAQITPANVGSLTPVWTYHTGVVPGGKASFQVTPIKVGERLFLCSGTNVVIALDAETGKEIWKHDPKVDDSGIYGHNCRGVTYYAVPRAKGLCAERIFTATLDARIIALDAATGTPCPGFGKGGEISLLPGMGVVEKGYYHVTSPPQLVRGKLVIGGWVTDGQMTGEPSGVIRAFDAVTGAFAWAFDSGRPDVHGLPPEGQSYTRGTPNSWAPMSADEALGLVYVPTGNATPDYVGSHRSAQDDKYSSSVIALDAETGAERWKFQTVHHDLWDYDVPAQPTLIELPGGIPALIQPTKRGEVFVLDRRTGKPIRQVEERAVPQGAVPGERTSTTQPFSAAMPSFAGAMPTEKRMWGLTPIDQAMCRIRFREARFEGTMTPIGSDRPTLTWPGYLGGMDWGGISVDVQNHILITNTNGIANYNRLLKRDEANAMGLKPVNKTRMDDLAGPLPQMGTPYGALIAPFLSPFAIPCQQPPYGMISATSLITGKLLWTKPLGTSRDSGPLLLPTLLPIPMGVPNIGGSVTTAGGLIFIGATQEHTFRAIETATGRMVWSARLPAGGNANPASYWSPKSGRQFVVIAAGGHGAMLSGSSDTVIAYALSK
jgi:quinoprotein glucose dehydrogenase